MRIAVMALVAVTTSIVGMLQTTPPVKMGLWETTETTTLAMPPEMAQKMKAMGMQSGVPTTTKKRACYTPEVWEKAMGMKPLTADCKVANHMITARNGTISMTCNTGGVTLTVDAALTFDSTEAWHGTGHSTSTFPPNMMGGGKDDGRYGVQGDVCGCGLRECRAGQVGGTTMTTASRETALALMQEWTQGESLRKHALSVSFCCEAYGLMEAARLGLTGGAAEEMGDTYACAGLLHDFDYERHPSLEEHPFVGVAYLREHGWPEEILHAILAHADYSGVKPETHLDKALFACDELAGFLTACALVKPTKSIHDVEAKGAVKKMKDKGFARAVKREDMAEGALLLGLSLEEHVANCLRALQARAKELGSA